MPAAKAKASRHAITPQLRPQDKVSLPVASFVAPSGSDGTIKVRCRSRSSRRAATTGRTVLRPLRWLENWFAPLK